jgi:SAM-dependent methyltransferase
MSSDKRLLLEKVPPGRGISLDIGGGDGHLSSALEDRGYEYVNVDLRPSGVVPAVAGDAHRLPLKSGCALLAISCDSLEHFEEPLTALTEINRVLRPDGTLVMMVPFLHPFHGDDLFRYTPEGLRLLFRKSDFSIVSLESPLWIASFITQILVVVLKRLRLGFLERPLERAAAWIDQRLRRFQGDMGFAAAYLVVAQPLQRRPVETASERRAMESAR